MWSLFNNVACSSATLYEVIITTAQTCLFFDLTGHTLTLQSGQSYENKGWCAKAWHISTIMINGMENMGNKISYKTWRLLL